MDKKDFNDEKRALKMYFKQFKAGLIPWKMIPLHFQNLLQRYYGVKRSMTPLGIKKRDKKGGKL